MKKTLILLVLLFSSSIFAEDISDFQIEGMSVGDSLLDYFSEEEINENKRNYLNRKAKFYVVSSGNLKLKNFENLEFYLKTDDNKYLIYLISGAISFENNIGNCKKKKDEIVNEIKDLFNNSEMIDYGTYTNSYDKSGLSKNTRVGLWINSDYVAVECIDWSKEIERKNNWSDNVRLGAVTKEAEDWIQGGYK